MNDLERCQNFTIQNRELPASFALLAASITVPVSSNFVALTPVACFDD